MTRREALIAPLGLLTVGTVNSLELPQRQNDIKILKYIVSTREGSDNILHVELCIKYNREPKPEETSTISDLIRGQDKHRNLWGFIEKNYKIDRCHSTGNGCEVNFDMVYKLKVNK